MTKNTRTCANCQQHIPILNTTSITLLNEKYPPAFIVTCMDCAHFFFTKIKQLEERQLTNWRE